MSVQLHVLPEALLFSIAYWSIAESIMRRSSRMRVACERLRERRKLGTAIAARSAMIATTIMISTRVKPPRFLFSFCNIWMYLVYFSLCHSQALGLVNDIALSSGHALSIYDYP